MDKYLFHERLLQCKMMDKTKLNENIWKGANKTFKVGLAYRAARSAHNKSQSDKNKGTYFTRKFSIRKFAIYLDYLT